MKKLICSILLFCLSSNVLADCDWTQIKKLPDGGYEYTPTLNLCVGQLVQDSAVKDRQIDNLTTALDLRNAALVIADQRTALWEKTSDDELQRLNTMQSQEHSSNVLYFALGVATTFAAGYIAAEAIKH